MTESNTKSLFGVPHAELDATSRFESDKYLEHSSECYQPLQFPMYTAFKALYRCK